eukprot:tig00021352_g20684.t1
MLAASRVALHRPPCLRRQLSTSVDHEEVRKFTEQARNWWAADGPARGLHSMNEVRVPFIVAGLQAQLDLPRSSGAARPLDGVRILDVGCGGGILAEPLARLGAHVTGIDATPASVEMARAHAEAQPDIAERLVYRQTTAEEVAGEGRSGRGVAVTTISRTPLSFALAIVAAEYVAGLVPRGTHDWRRFVRPDELTAELRRAGLEVRRAAGMAYNPLLNRWRATDGLDVNYASSPPAPPRPPRTPPPPPAPARARRRRRRRGARAIAPRPSHRCLSMKQT